MEKVGKAFENSVDTENLKFLPIENRMRCRIGKGGGVGGGRVIFENSEILETKEFQNSYLSFSMRYNKGKKFRRKFQRFHDEFPKNFFSISPLKKSPSLNLSNSKNTKNFNTLILIFTTRQRKIGKNFMSTTQIPRYLSHARTSKIP